MGLEVSMAVITFSLSFIVVFIYGVTIGTIFSRHLSSFFKIETKPSNALETLHKSMWSDEELGQILAIKQEDVNEN